MTAAELRRRPAARAIRKADAVASDLMSRVVAGELAVGAILPREDELAAQYDVNRSVVREAVKLLEVHRLVLPTKRRGTEVLDPMRSLSPEVLRAMLRPRPGVIDARMLAGLLEVRAALDVELSGLAAARRTDDDLAQMDACVAEASARRGDRAAYGEAIRALPIHVARATQNPVLVMLAHWNEVVAADLEELFAATRPTSAPHLQGVTLLVDLIRRREVEATRSLVRAFHDWGVPRIVAAAALATGAPLTVAPATTFAFDQREGGP